MKKILFLFLLILIPMIAFADKSGSCGKNVKWKYVESTQTLTIFGNGDMKNYDYRKTAPWKKFDIQNIIIENGLTSIGEYAFYECFGLTSITIPNSVTSIGGCAFSYCSNLTSITIPNSVTSIGFYAFNKCSSLTSITIPNSVTSIGEAAFEDCSGLTSVTIPNSITRLEKYTFVRCSRLTSITIPNSVTSIGQECFIGCYSLTSVNIPNSVTSIGFRIFYRCTGLTSITIPNSVTSIGEGAFKECSSLASITIPTSVTSIGLECFIGCSGLTSLIVPNSAISIGEKAFLDCNKISDVRCEDGSFPLWFLPYLPDKCLFMLAQKYQQPANNNIYSQNIQQPVVPTKPDVPKEEKKSPSSDVDINLPTTAENNNKTFVVIFANENYQEVANVEYALNDGEIFKKYCKSVLGIPEKNIHLRKNATKNNMIAELAWMSGVADAYNGVAKFIVYYAGHGIPDEKTKAPYLLPVDGLANNPVTAYNMAQFYQELSSMDAARVTVFMDACFSGAQRSGDILVSARGVVIEPRTEAPAGNMVVFSAAQGDETAYPYKEKEHGLFTYFLLKKLRDTKGDCTLQELGDYIRTNVKQQSIVVNSKSQTPSVSASPALSSSWSGLKLK